MNLFITCILGHTDFFCALQSRRWKLVNKKQVFTRKKEGGPVSSSSSAIDTLGMSINASFYEHLPKYQKTSWGLYFKVKILEVFMELLIWTVICYITEGDISLTTH